MTIKGEFVSIFTQYDEGVENYIILIALVKWINRYKNIVKDQDSINDLLWRISMDDSNLIVQEFILGMNYQSLRDEINKMK